MERDVSVLVLESSKVVAAQMVELIKSIAGVNHIFYGATFEKPVHLLYSDKVDVVVCGLVLSDENLSKLIELRITCKPFCLMLVTDDIEKYKEKYADLGIDFYLSYQRMSMELPELFIRAAEITFQPA